MEEPLTVVDVGSNSIKLLVAAPGNPVDTLLSGIREVRISADMYGQPPTLRPESMEAGVHAIRELLGEAEAHTRKPPVIVATSAVREAANGEEFARAVETAFGVPLRILTGEQEARYICRGALCDPSLFGADTFRLVDLGGGSLEVVLYNRGEVEAADSLPLGAVRLTARFVRHPGRPVPPEVHTAIRTEVRKRLEAAGIDLAHPPAPLICSGGAFGIARNLIQPRCPKLEVRDLVHWRDKLSAMTLDERRAIPQLPPERADIMVPALQVMITVAECARAKALLNTRFNLRYGIASEILEKHS